MSVFLVETIKRSNNEPVLCSADEVILYHTRAQAEEFIRSLDKSDKYYYIVKERTVCNPHPVDRGNYQKNANAIKCGIDALLRDYNLNGILAKDVLERAVAKWIADYAVSYFHTPDEMTDVIFGVCKEIQTEAMEEWSNLDVEVQSMGSALMEGSL